MDDGSIDNGIRTDQATVFADVILIKYRQILPIFFRQYDMKAIPFQNMESIGFNQGGRQPLRFLFLFYGDLWPTVSGPYSNSTRPTLDKISKKLGNDVLIHSQFRTVADTFAQTAAIIDAIAIR